MQIPDIETLIPQRAPMLFIEAVETWTTATIETRGRVAQSWPLVRVDQVPGVSVFEFMTQTVAAHQALCAMQAGHVVSGIGVVTGCRHFRVDIPSLLVGTPYRVSAEQLWGDGPSGMYGAQVFVAEAAVASARFSVRQLSPDELTKA